MTDDDGDGYGILLTPPFVRRYSRAFRNVTIAKLIFIAGLSGEAVLEDLDEVSEDDRKFAAECCRAARERCGDDVLGAALGVAAESIICLSDPEIRGLSLKYCTGPLRGRATQGEIDLFLFEERARIVASPRDALEHLGRVMDKFPER